MSSCAKALCLLPIFCDVALAFGLYTKQGRNPFKLTVMRRVQVAGFKFLRLYSRQQTPLLYVERGQATQSAMNATRAQKNISAVNVEHPDLKKHPGFAQAKHLECVLGPGDMLFIPAKVWHHVRSLSPAISGTDRPFNCISCMLPYTDHYE